MKKRILAVVMTAAMVLGALTGCGQSSRMIRQNQLQQQKQKPSAMMY
ncbi:MAG: hypothetical protein ACLR5Q_06120 [Coprococcus sp.]